MDDIFLLFQKEDHVNKFEKYLSSRHKNINFKSEKEKDNCLSFLDVLVTRSNGFITSVYRKKTFSGIYLNFHSFVPDIYKKGFISCLLYRAYRICSNPNLIHEEVKYLKTLWLGNKYPSKFIEFCVKTFFDKISQEKVSKIDSDKIEIKIMLPFLGSHTNVLKTKLSKLLSNISNNYKPIFVFTTGRKLASFFNFKDRVPTNVRSFVIYKYTCGVCNVTYTGKTKRHMGVRMAEHLGLSLRTGKILKFNKNNASAIRKHCEFEKHTGSYDNFEVVGTGVTDFQLLLKESMIINRDSPILNKQVKTFKLELF